MEVNGTVHQVDAAATRTLLDILRNHLGLTGTKYGCGEGQCGSCTVHMNGAPVRACTLPLSACFGKRFVTVEGLADGNELHPVQVAFVEERAMQCGFCTPGMVMAAKALLDEHADPTDAQILTAMNGNICRCGAYPPILRAIRRASERMRGGE
ncbi:MAG: (2Fe-2S)-binding protein [Myxococcales bacterium FL481]|nr:MAG: (2Fe-2S)-binding protein [Myxococcales bacterium FL481]